MPLVEAHGYHHAHLWLEGHRLRHRHSTAHDRLAAGFEKVAAKYRKR
jgi:hypothetical protein